MGMPEIPDVNHSHVDETGQHKIGHAHPGGDTAHPHRIQVSADQVTYYPADRWEPGIDTEVREIRPRPTAVTRLIEGERAGFAQAELERTEWAEQVELDLDEWQKLRKWLDSFFGALTDLAITKAMEYGSGDFEVMSPVMRLMVEKAMPEGLSQEAREAWLTEAVMVFYMAGKIGRMASAFGQGKLPGDDNYRDLAVYAAMAQKVRETGKWT